MNFRSDFIKAFQRLDLDALSKLIDFNKEYCGIWGNLFYDKLCKMVFNFQSADSPEMICKIGICQCKNSAFYGNFGVSFMEMKEKQYVSFAFDKDGNKIHECFSLKLDEEIDLKSFSRLSFPTYDDQKVDFKPDEE